MARTIAVRDAILRVAPHLVVVAAMLHGIAAFWSPGVGLTRLVLFGEQFAGQTVPALESVPHAVELNASGYDGQFYAQLALDPLLLNDATIDAMDLPAYRARRVLFPLAAYIAGLGHPVWVVTAYTFLNTACWLLFAFLLWIWLPPGSGRAFAAWIGCVLANGWIASIRLSLTDGPTVLLVALGVLAVERARSNLGAGTLALAVLGRETSALGAVVLLPRSWRDVNVATLLRIAAVVAPFTLWVLYLRHLGLTDTGVRNNVGLPFVAFIDKWAATLSELRTDGWESWSRVSLVAIVGMTVQAIFFIGRWRWRSAWWRIGVVHAVVMLFLGPAVWGGYPGAATRAMLPLAVAFNIELMQTGKSFWPLWILGNLAVTLSSELIPIPYLGSLI